MMRLYFWLCDLLYDFRGCISSVNFSKINGDDEWFTSENSFDESYDVDSSIVDNDIDYCGINPANGLPMMGCIDVAGNPYGFDCSLFDDSFESLSGDSFADSLSDDGFIDSSIDDCFSSDDICDSGSGFDEW